MPFDGQTELLPLLGYPIHAVKAPAIYNPYFESSGINAVVIPMSCPPPAYTALVQGLFALENVRGALVTMPHKVATAALLDETSVAVRVAGACNAIRRDAHGRLIGDLFDGEGFVRAARRKGVRLQGASALVAGSGGVGCAIAAALAGAGVARLALFDAQPERARSLADRLLEHYPHLQMLTGSSDPAGFDVVVNATPLGVNAGDPLPFDVERIAAGSFVGEVVMKTTMTPLLRAAEARGCLIQIGADMLFEQIPLYLAFFGLPSTDPDTLRRLAKGVVDG